jgi:hypothetical protein
MLQPGSYDTDFGFERIYTEEKVAQVSSLIDTLIWQGNPNVTGQTSLCTGFIYLAENTFSGSVVNGNVTSATAITPSNIVGLVDDAIQVIPTNIVAQDDLYLYCGYDFARTYFTALRNSNLYNYPSVETGANDFMITIPSSNVKLVAVKGLTGTDKFFISAKSNCWFGTDLLSDYEDIQIWYSMDFQESRTNIRWKQGVQFAFPEYVVYFSL